MAGQFCISLDFELMWGVHDSRSIESYRANILGVREAIPAMLQLFSNHQISATWATVGFLFCRTKAEILEHKPALLPEYSNAALSTYRYFDTVGEGEADDPLHFAPSLLKQIAGTQGQEIALHSFSHYYCCEKGATLESFEADTKAALAAASSWPFELKSYVFPRNQFADEFVALLAKNDITHVRSNESHWAYNMSSGNPNHAARRLFRIADSYVNLSGHHVAKASKQGASTIVPASRFLRPYSEKLAAFDALKLARIKAAMTAAAKTGGLFHLWWHPHNFGVNTAKNIEMLRQIAQHFDMLAEVYGMESVAMKDIKA